MPSEAAEYLLANGDVVFIEADVSTDYSEERVSIFGKRVGGGPPRLAEAMAKVAPAIEEVYGRIVAMPLKPSEISVEVGIKFVGESGVVIARVSAEANLVIKLKWTPAAPSPV